jgi:hypothetical protein
MAGNASRENGKKGGRPKGLPALEAERARIMIAEKLVTEFEPIVDKAIMQAKEGLKDAREWLTDRAYGKPKSSTELTGRDGTPLFNNELTEKAKKAIEELISDEDN